MLLRYSVRRYVCWASSRQPLRWHRAFAVSAHARNDITDSSAISPQSEHDELNPIVRDYLAKRHLQKLGSQGSKLSAFYNPNDYLDNPPEPEQVTLEMLLAAEAHFGHVTSLWNPANSRYIFGVRSDIHIISLDITAQALRRAARVVSGVAERAGLILFVGNKNGFQRAVVKAAQLAAPACHLFSRWTPGAITNANHLLHKNRIKAVDDLDNEVQGVDHLINSSPPLAPDLVVCLNPIENYALLHECALNRIPTIGVIDTDADPTWVTYPIPANDDSLRCIQLIAGVLGNAARHGHTKRKAAVYNGRTPEPNNDLWFQLPRSFNVDRYLTRREEQNKGQLCRDVQAKLEPAEVRAIASGTPVHSLDNIDERLRPDEILILRRAYETGFIPPTSSAAEEEGQDTAAALLKSPREEQERVEKALADVADLAAEASYRAEQLKATGGKAEPPTAEADHLVDLNGNPWDAPSAVIKNSKSLKLTTAERQLLVADIVREVELIALRPKIPRELFSALVEELKAAGKILPVESDPDNAYDDGDDEDGDDEDDDGDDGETRVRRGRGRPRRR